MRNILLVLASLFWCLTQAQNINLKVNLVNQKDEVVLMMDSSIIKLDSGAFTINEKHFTTFIHKLDSSKSTMGSIKLEYDNNSFYVHILSDYCSYIPDDSYTYFTVMRKENKFKLIFSSRESYFEYHKLIKLWKYE